MVEIIWEFVVKEDAQGQFELAYGPGGAWSRLLARCEGFRGITVLRHTGNRRRYLTIEVWETAARREQAITERKAEHAEVEAAMDEWVESKTEVGTFTMLAEAAVRPRSAAGRAGRRTGR